MILSLLLSFLFSSAQARAPRPSECPDLDKLYPKLEATYVRKAPLFAKAGWGSLQDWTGDDFEDFRLTILRCRERGFLKKFDPVFLESDVEKKIQEMKREASRLKDDKKIAATLAEYRAKIDALAKNLNEEKAAELKDLKVLLQRITGLDESSYFNESAKLQNRIDLILKKNPAAKKEAPPKMEVVTEDLEKARKAEPERFQKCESLRLDYEALVAESLSIDKKNLAEKEVEAMKVLAKQKEDVLHKLESLTIQMRELTCAKYLGK